MCEDKSFHIHAPVTGKVRRPTVESLTAGTDRLSAVEDRSLCRDGMSAAHTCCPISHFHKKITEIRVSFFEKYTGWPLSCSHGQIP